MKKWLKKAAGVTVVAVGMMLVAGGPVLVSGGTVEAIYEQFGGGAGGDNIPSGSTQTPAQTPTEQNPEGTNTGTQASGKVETAILPDNWGIENILKLILNVVVYGLGVAAVLGVVIAGVMYMTARDNESQATAARKRLLEIAIGLIAWAVMYGVLNWLIPGGLNI